MRIYKKFITLMLVISLILPNALFLTAFADDEIIIATGSDFITRVISADFGKTFVIEGTEILDDGSLGIILPEGYTSVSDFNGTLKGVDGKNNIQLAAPLFASLNGNTGISNLNLKPYKNVGFATPDDQGHGALVSVISSAGTYNIEKVVNYCNISSSKYYLGGLVGKVTDGTLNMTLCANYGAVSGSSRHVGGLIGGLNNVDNITFTVSKSFNAGTVTGDRYTAGIAGLVTVSAGIISDGFNSGNITTTSSKDSEGGAGIAVPSSSCKNLSINNVYNAGGVTHSDGEGTNTARLSNIAYSDRVSESSNCCYIANSNATRTSVGYEVTSDALAVGLPTGFDSSCWEFVSVEGTDDEYKYPQIKGNTLWNDYKYYCKNDTAALTSSAENGEITEISTGWEMADNENVYMSSPAGYEISHLALYRGINILPLLRGDMSSTSSVCSFRINKSAEIYIATDKNPSDETISAVRDGGFTQVLNSDDTPATVVTKGGAVYYLSKKTVVVSEGTKNVEIGNGTGLDKAYFIFVNWLDNATVTFDLSGNENIYINDELYSASKYTAAKGGVFKIKIEPKANYYVNDFIIDGESEKQNIITYYEKDITALKDITIKSEAALYEFTDDNLTDDITYPDYQLVQEIDGGTGLTVQSIKAEGYLGEFLQGCEVTMYVKKNELTVASTKGTVNSSGKVQITASVGATEGDCEISFTVDISGTANNISVKEDKKTFSVPSVADVNQLISDLNSAQITKEALTALILEERETLAFNPRVYKELDPAIQAKISADMISLTGYSVSNLYTRFDNFVIINTLNMSDDSGDVERLFKNYVYETFIDFSQIYNEYLALADKSGVCAGMLGVTYQNTSEIFSQFEYAFVKDKLSVVISYDNILTELDKYDTLLGIETKVAAALSKNINEIKVINEGIGESLSSLTTKALFITKLDDLILNSAQLVIDKTEVILPSPSPSLSAGGGGGGGGSVSVSDDYVEVPEVTPVDESGSGSFTDLGEASWARDSIDKLFYKGIIKGKEEGKFCPDDKVTRAEFVKMAVTAFKLEIENPVCDYTDVTKDHWAYKYIASASDIGIVNGYSAEEFGAEGSITRQDVVAILIRIIYRLSKYEAMENRKNPGVTFTDEEEIADYALGGVTMFAGSGIVSGYEDGSFRPTQDLTRAEAAVILNNVLEFFSI